VSPTYRATDLSETAGGASRWRTPPVTTEPHAPGLYPHRTPDRRRHRRHSRRHCDSEVRRHEGKARYHRGEIRPAHYGVGCRGMGFEHDTYAGYAAPTGHRASLTMTPSATGWSGHASHASTTSAVISRWGAVATGTHGEGAPFCTRLSAQRGVRDEFIVDVTRQAAASHRCKSDLMPDRSPTGGRSCIPQRRLRNATGSPRYGWRSFDASGCTVKSLVASASVARGLPYSGVSRWPLA
jgi:hypothetical protein